MKEAIAAGFDKKEVTAMESGAMCCLMSKQRYARDSIAHGPPHIHAHQ
jgi:hypothetical protein